MLKKLVIIICSALATYISPAHEATQTLNSSQKLAVTSENNMLSIVTHLKPIQMIIAGYLDIADQEVRQLQAHTNSILSIKYDPQDRFFASASRDGTIAIYDSSTFEKLHTLKSEKSWFAKHVFDDMRSISIKPDGQRLLSCNVQQPLFAPMTAFFQSWNTQNGKCVKKFKSHVVNYLPIFLFSPCGRYTALRLKSSIKILDAQADRYISTINLLDHIEDAQFSLDGNFFVAISHLITNGTSMVHLFEVVTGNQKEQWPIEGYRTFLIKNLKNRQIAIIGDSDRLKICDIAKRKMLFDIKIDDEYVIRAEFSPNGEYIAAIIRTLRSTKQMIAGLKACNLRMFKLPQNQNSEIFDSKPISFLDGVHASALAFSPSGKFLVVGKNDGKIHVFKNQAIELLQTFIEIDKPIANGPALLERKQTKRKSVCDVTDRCIVS